ncbi:hypothetical protein L1049_001544 [Liquidambar formosana]|uniref:Uncharacterized protein n=1 Tax=Liquidambar formosana TaxID=63359 RepID=A0AAP0NCZ8_LIQFO
MHAFLEMLLVFFLLHCHNLLMYSFIFQKKVMLMAKPILEESIVNLYMSSFPECLKIADMGCSSGPNTLTVVSEIMDIIDATCKHLNRKTPMFQVFLNDLPGNDFNNIFKSLPSFYNRLKREKGDEFGPCFIAGIPGSFHGSLFPNHSLHFVHSSQSLHWLSQVPKGLMSKSGISLNKGNIYIAKTSPPSVLKAYQDQFAEDFTLFLRYRSKEMIPGGYMVLAMSCSEAKQSSNAWELLGLALNDMVLEGLIEEAKLDSFNLPLYASTSEEVRRVVQTEGSFNIQRLEIFKSAWDSNIDNGNKSLEFDKHTRGKYVAKTLRAVAESILGSYFGYEIMDDLFDRFAKKIVEYWEVEKGEKAAMLISMVKKE